MKNRIYSKIKQIMLGSQAGRKFLFKRKVPASLYRKLSREITRDDINYFSEALKNGYFTGHRAVAEIIKSKIMNLLDRNKKIYVLYSPSGAYRRHFGELKTMIRARNRNVILFYEDEKRDFFEDDSLAFHINGLDRSILEIADVLVCNTPCDIPHKPHSILLIHDIHDSLVGDEIEHVKLIANFDYLYLPSKYSYDLYERLLKGMKKKQALVPGGYIRLDDNIRLLNGMENVDNKSILYAPTITDLDFDEYTSLPAYGLEIVGYLRKRFPGVPIIFRPHPHTLETRYVKDIMEKFCGDEMFSLSSNMSSYISEFNKSCMLITDLSGTAYTYSFTTKKPVIFFSGKEKELKERFAQSQYIKDREKIGMVVQTLDELGRQVEKILKRNHAVISKNDIETYCNSVVYNLQESEGFFINNMKVFEGQKNHEWKQY